jgi:hypothetical protein
LKIHPLRHTIEIRDITLAQNGPYCSDFRTPDLLS